MMLARLGFMTRAYSARVGPLVTRSMTPIRSRRKRAPGEEKAPLFNNVVHNSTTVIPLPCGWHVTCVTSKRQTAWHCLVKLRYPSERRPRDEGPHLPQSADADCARSSGAPARAVGRDEQGRVTTCPIPTRSDGDRRFARGLGREPVRHSLEEVPA